MSEVIVIELDDLDLIENEVYKLIRNKENVRIHSFLKYNIKTKTLSFHIHLHLYRFVLRKGKVTEIKSNYSYEQYHRLFKRIKNKIFSEIFHRKVEVIETNDRLRTKETSLYYSFDIELELNELIQLLCLKQYKCNNLSYISYSLKFKNENREMKIKRYPDVIYINERIINKTDNKTNKILEIEILEKEDNINFEYMDDKDEHLAVEIEKNQITIYNLKTLNFEEYKINEKTFKVFKYIIFKLLSTSFNKKLFQDNFIKFFNSIKTKIVMTNFLL